MGFFPIVLHVKGPCFLDSDPMNYFRTILSANKLKMKLLSLGSSNWTCLIQIVFILFLPGFSSLQQAFAQSPSLLKNINPGISDGLPAAFAPVPYQNLFLFEATTANEGKELWRTDGTTAGTYLVADINPGTASSTPRGFFQFNGIVYFSATTAQEGIELWRTDGTESGTFLVKDIYSGTSNGLGTLSVVWQNNGLFYFEAKSLNNTNSELWKSDGTEAGTTILKDINPGTAGSSPSSFFTWNGQLYFNATTAANGRELWKTNGTSTGTVMVKDIYPGSTGSIPSSAPFWEKNGFFFFLAANGAASNREIWKSDGTTAGTTLLKEIGPGTAGCDFDGYYEMNGILYFSAGDNTLTGSELWKTDGTTAGTSLIKDILPLTGSSMPNGLNVFWEKNGSFYFKAYNTEDVGPKNEEIWMSNGTAAGTKMLKEINTGDFSSESRDYFPFEGNLYFAAKNINYGNELWKTDGTSAGTVMVKDINPGIYSCFPTGLFIAWQKDGYFYYRAWTSYQTSTTNADGELWRSNGTSAGTTRVKDINPGVGNGFDGVIHSDADFLYFSADNGTNGNELWKTDGTTAGTTLLKDLYTGSADGEPSTVFATYNGFYYFTALNTASTNREIWRTNGTTAGTTLVMDINVGASGSFPDNFAILNNRYLMFRAFQAVTGRELWTFDFPGITTHTLSPEPISLINLWPNPCNESLQIDFPFEAGMTNVDVYNIKGISVLSLETSDKNISVNTRNFSPGLYQIRIRNGQKAQTKKVLVEH